MASTIKVDNVQNQPGTNIINKCSVTTTIGAGAGETIKACAATVTLGRCGGTVALASGATQTGFGRTGTVDWQTGDIKTAAFIPATGKGYFVNTTAGAVTVNLPAGTAGDIIGLKDYANTWDTYAVTLNPNGAQLIGGGSSIDPTLTSEGGSTLLVYVDGTQGWLATEQGVTASPSGLEIFVVATGGTITTSGDYKIHTFTGPGAFCVSSLATTPANNNVSYMVIGGSGGKNTGGAGPGGGGAGGMREFTNPADPYAPGKSPTACGTALTVSVSSYPVTVGATGGTGNGSVSTFNCKSSAGGGYGHYRGNNGNPGGSGGGGGDYHAGTGGNGNDPPTSPSQGNPGFSGTTGEDTGAGGGAGSSPPSSTQTNNPGTGAATTITGSSVTYATGGDGEGGNDISAPLRGTGYGHGKGGTFPCSPQPSATSMGGSVIIRYKYQ